MSLAKQKPKAKTFLIKNWYKLAILGFFCYLFLQKDLSFQINLNAPFQESEPTIEEFQKETEQTPQIKPAKKQLEKITQNEDLPKISINNKEGINQLGFGFAEKGISSEEAFSKLSKIEEGVKVKFLKRFAHVAINERKKFGIPSSIILANALLHSQAGKSVEAQNGHNFFSISCTQYWTGISGNYDNGCFRHYSNAWSSFRDHSLYLTSNQFSDLRNLGSQNYKTWAAALAQKQYSNESNLEEKLLQLIQEFQLYELDKK